MIDTTAIHSPWPSKQLIQVEPLSPACMHVWLVKLSISDDQGKLAREWLNSYQLNKLNRRRGELQKQAYLAGRFHLFEFLSHYSGMQPSDVHLKYSRLNKPFLVGPAGHLEFNFSDTKTDHGHYGLFAFALNRAVGVDIECLKRQSNYEAIAKRRFSETELNYVKDARGLVNRERFLSIWTRKEGFGKALGKGINFTMNQHNLLNPDSAEYLAEYGEESWTVKQFALDLDLISAVVHQGPPDLEIQTFIRA